jgi:hypothetical protein
LARGLGDGLFARSGRQGGDLDGGRGVVHDGVLGEMGVVGVLGVLVARRGRLGGLGGMGILVAILGRLGVLRVLGRLRTVGRIVVLRLASVGVGLVG